MNVKFTLLIGVMVGIFLFSCSKRVEDDMIDSGNFLKVTIDGEQHVYTDVQGRWVDGGNYLEITARQDAATWLRITVLSENGRVTTGDYTLDDASGFDILSLYTKPSNDAQLNYAATRATISLLDAFSLKIQAIGDRSVEGTFTGNLIRVQGLEVLGEVQLSDGSFVTSISAE
ncbi:hypothetical protein PQ465_07425 [Sphingobacterium oryzagri]|uniref:DUF4382 domain-containing protein n=1 Tax=Sphingobacterium oryzagri TaxID=3025669 RepID=A0ABY7WSB6_9SPHI|nr:hypothetical protein [Sphingobacterium sp. KACC 22765]WDF70199.1 hypothetical protein PQ465_07425 [Sphingobacterium sp. KACC 22765]